jgi:F1F0 ATPase subunit 2
MQSISLIQLLFAGLFGMVLGGLYFALLWLTVKHLATIRWPAIWVLLSLVLRLGGLLAGLYWITDGSWKRLVAALLGVIVARVVFTRYLRPDAAVSKKVGYGNG